ncbi:MAG: nucleotidyltransferase domain-containing protein [Candidatus Aminicenantes bacterium]|nr:nucleotidyltransferase domain-containing protein [Candidatus Aminicenantes bacterium]
MRQTASSGSVKAIWLNKNLLLEKLKNTAEEARKIFPEIIEIRLIGSLARNEETGLSDVDIFIISNTVETNPLERIKPYYYFFSERLKIALDVMVARPEELSGFENFEKMLEGSIILA